MDRWIITFQVVLLAISQHVVIFLWKAFLGFVQCQHSSMFGDTWTLLWAVSALLADGAGREIKTAPLKFCLDTQDPGKIIENAELEGIHEDLGAQLLKRNIPTSCASLQWRSNKRQKGFSGAVGHNSPHRHHQRVAFLGNVLADPFMGIWNTGKDVLLPTNCPAPLIPLPLPTTSLHSTGWSSAFLHLEII